MRDGAILIVTRKFDPHADHVIGILNRRGIPFFRLNTDDFHADIATEASGNDGTIRLSDRWGRTHRFPEQTRSVWHRKPVDPAPPDGIDDPATRTVIQQETQEFLTYLAGDDRVPWINNPHANQAARRKFPQIRMAAALGLRVPRTLVTNDAAAARAFHDDLDGRLLCKSMSAIGFEDGEQYRPIFSRRVTPDEFAAHLGQIALCPSLLQEYIDKDHELRVTIIGDDLFCCRIDSQGIEGAETDWRRVDPFAVPHRIVPPPPGVEQALRAILSRYGLRFGTFDLIVTPAGEPVFLELNPNGQWLWIEMITAAAMGEAMADLLAEP